jgi:hypothetical protein
MADSIDERRKARELYMQNLANLKEKAVDNNVPVHMDRPNQTQVSAAQRREQMLEEKRKKFFSQKNSSESNSTEISKMMAEPIAYTDFHGAPKNQVKATFIVYFPFGMNKLYMFKKVGNHESVNLADWKRKGYPSEYAYAKEVGLLDLKPASKKNIVYKAFYIDIHYRLISFLSAVSSD